MTHSTWFSIFMVRREGNNPLKSLHCRFLHKVKTERLFPSAMLPDHSLLQPRADFSTKQMGIALPSNRMHHPAPPHAWTHSLVTFTTRNSQLGVELCQCFSGWGTARASCWTQMERLMIVFHGLLEEENLPQVLSQDLI